ncbi:DUF3015 family protein [Salinisphaera hydrothermalis]|uniref:DUF3015 family protein n=1 Tax=Salinisphaera hydrothermalis TaxID=563188 RepID=UPI0033416EDF
MVKPLGLAALVAVFGITGCAAVTSTTNTTADALQTAGHGISVSSRSSTNASRGQPQSARAAQTRAYVRSEMAQLRREAARGGGEHIDALAELMGRDNAPALGPWMQKHYNRLFAPQQSTAAFVQNLQSARS